MIRPAIGFTLLVAACGGDGGRQVETAAATTLAATPDAVVATAESTTVERPLSLPSQLYVEHDAAVLARSSGVVEAILADIGTPEAPFQPMYLSFESFQRRARMFRRALGRDTVSAELKELIEADDVQVHGADDR